MTQCAIECTAVPDGFVGTGAKDLQLSILLRPCGASTMTGSPVRVEADQWPTLVPQLFFQVWAGPTKDKLKYLSTIAAAEAFEGKLTPEITGQAQAWWNKILPNPQDISDYLALVDGTTADPAVVDGYDYNRLQEAATRESEQEFERAAYSFGARASKAVLSKEFSGLMLRAARHPNDRKVQLARCLAIARTGNFPSTRSMARSNSAELVDDWTESGGFFDDLLNPGPSGALLSERQLDRDYWLALNPNILEPVVKSENAAGERYFAFSVDKADQQIYDSFEKAMQTDKELGAAPRPPEKPANAHRVLGALQAHPALRKHVRQIADIALDASTLRDSLGVEEGDLQGVIAVLASTTAAAPADPNVAPGEAIGTAFVLRTDKTRVFEPCPKDEFSEAAPFVPAAVAAATVTTMPLRDGFVFQPDGERRFQVASLDAMAAYYAREKAVSSVASAYFRGTAEEHLSPEPPGYRTRGLMLLDTKAKETAQTSEDREATLVKERLLFAEDLIDGYRVDVVAPNDKVFPACARKIAYVALDGLKAEAMRYYDNERNDGYVSPLARTWEMKKPGSNDTQRHLSVSQVLFTWTGRALGVPADPLDTATTDPLGLDYAFDPARKGPILRQYGQYRFMLRARKLNGSSVALSSSRLSEFALGSSVDLTRDEDPAPDADPGYTFGFAEKAPVPALLVDEKFTPAVGPDPADKETIDTIVIVANDPNPRVRWLATPVVGFDLAEMQGQFDPVDYTEAGKAQARRRAAQGAYRYLVHDASGAFPTLSIGNDIVGLKFARKPATSAPAGRPHYFDATLRTVGARLIATKGTAAETFSNAYLPDEAAFFPEAKHARDVDPDKVAPIRLEIRSSGPGGRTGIRNGPNYDLKLADDKTKIMSVPTICIDVAPGDTLELELWINRDSKAVAANPAVAAAVKRVETTTKFQGFMQKSSIGGHSLYTQMTQQHRVSSLSDVMKLRIEHPVARPLVTPNVVEPLRAYRDVTAPSWSANVSKHAPRDVLNAGKLFSIGKIEVNRPSTGEVWAEASWVEHASRGRVFRTGNEEDLDRIEQDGLWERKTPTLTRRLFSLPTLLAAPRYDTESDDEYVKRVNDVDLLFEDGSDPPSGGSSNWRVARNLTAEFDCDQHRTLAVRLLARSRFAPTPTTQKPDAPKQAEDAPEEDLTHIVRTSTSAACREAVETGRFTDGVWRVELLATRRPMTPYVTRDKGASYIREFTPTNDPGEVRLVHRYRCWLDGDWYDSGEGEKLAIVCRRSETTSLPGWADAQVSRWGGDMTMGPGQRLQLGSLPESQATYLLSRQIKTDEHEVGLLRHGEGPNEKITEVALACLEPNFHSGFGRWYCDIDLKPTGAYRAALKLVLARYQKGAIAGCELSPTVEVEVFMLPQPWRVKARRNGRKVDVTVTGPAYTARAPMLDQMDRVTATSQVGMLSDLIGDTKQTSMQAVTQAPLIVAELERLDKNRSGPLPVLNGGRAVVATSFGGDPQLVEEAVQDFQQGIELRQWKMSLGIPDEDAVKPLSVRVTLMSAHANSQARFINQDRARSPNSAQRDLTLLNPSTLDGPLVWLPEPITVEIAV